MTLPELKGVARTLLMPLACRAMEAMRPDAIIDDPCAVEVFNALGGGPDFLLGISGHDLFATVMRARQFDRFAGAFLTNRAGGLVVDIGCGLDTRFNRLDDGRMHWLGVDLPEVIALRRRVLPDTSRSRTLAQSMFDLSWLDVAASMNRPVIFLAEGVFPYFTTRDVKPLVTALTARFPEAELVFDAISPFMAWFHNKTNSVLRQTSTRVLWDVKDPMKLETWGLRLLERWGYFDKPEPRLGAINFIRFIPLLARASHILRYKLAGLPVL